MNKWLVSFAIALSMSTAGVQAAGDEAAGKTKSATCMACHGADGNSANPVWPKLAGQHGNYLLGQLQDFKTGARKNEMMSPMAAPLSDQDMADLAAYFSSQTQSPGTAAADQVQLGEKIYRAGNPNTKALYEEIGVQVTECDVSELLKGWGSLHCMTATLRRDPVGRLDS